MHNLELTASNHIRIASYKKCKAASGNDNELTAYVVTVVLSIKGSRQLQRKEIEKYNKLNINYRQTKFFLMLWALI